MASCHYTQVHLMGKMLENDPIVDSLLAENPFRGKPPPKHVRARLVDVLDNDDVSLYCFFYINIFLAGITNTPSLE